MKIGVVTYFNIKNYGSALQAYSLKTTCNKLGQDVVFLNVRESNPIYKIAHKLHVAFVTLVKFALYGTAKKTHKEIRSLKHKSESGISNEAAKLFDEFMFEQLPNINIDRATLRKVAHTDNFGAFICGSDQIWSPLSVHLSGYKFLNFAPRKKRIAYAPSFGVAAVPGYNKAFVRKMLLGFDDISVRENQGARIVKDLIGKEPTVVLDPTMLLSEDEWRTLYKDLTPSREREKYALCYFFDEPEKETVEQIAEYSRENNLKIVVLSSDNSQLISSGAELVDAGPLEFLRYMDESKCVFTNSFHGSVFSILFGRPLKVFGRNHSDTVKQTTRIDTLLETTGLHACMFRSLEEGIVPVSTDLARDRLSSCRDNSISYLKNALNKRAYDERVFEN